MCVFGTQPCSPLAARPRAPPPCWPPGCAPSPSVRRDCVAKTHRCSAYSMHAALLLPALWSHSPPGRGCAPRGLRLAAPQPTAPFSLCRQRRRPHPDTMHTTSNESSLVYCTSPLCRQRRRRLHPHPLGLLWPGGSQALRGARGLRTLRAGRHPPHARVCVCRHMCVCLCVWHACVPRVGRLRGHVCVGASL
jgi:hypothetical protein